MTSHRETYFLVSAFAAVAALFPLFFSYTTTHAPPVNPLVQTPNPDPHLSAPLTPTKPIPIRALVPYLLAVPRAIFAILAKPIGLVAYYLILIAAPALVVLDAVLSIISFPFRALGALLHALYPIYVLCGAAVLTGAVLGGLIAGSVKFVLLVQEVRRNRADMAEHEEWRKERRYAPRRDRYSR